MRWWTDEKHILNRPKQIDPWNALTEKKELLNHIKLDSFEHNPMGVK